MVMISLNKLIKQLFNDKMVKIIKSLMKKINTIKVKNEKNHIKNDIYLDFVILLCLLHIFWHYIGKYKYLI